MKSLAGVKAIKECQPGERVTFRAKVLRFWEIGGLRMALVGDASGLTRVEVGDVAVEAGRSYEFDSAEVTQYPGGWTSVSVVRGGVVGLIREEIDVPQDDAYVDRTFRILSGVQRKRGRREGRLPPWQHPAATDSEVD